MLRAAAEPPTREMLEMKPARAAIALVLAGVFSLAPTAGAERKEPPTSAQRGALKGSLVLTDQGHQLFQTWDSNPEHFTIPGLKGDKARRGLFLTATILFAGCAPDENGMCNATVTYIAYDPKGGVYGQLKDGELWIGKKAPEPAFSQLSAEYLGLVIEPKDPAGRYLIRATVTDHVARTTIEVARSFTVDPVPPAPLPTDTKANEIGNLTGVWKTDCTEKFGLRIAAIGNGRYSFSFCGPGGCSGPGYRRDSTIFGDDAYRVFDKNTIGVLGNDGDYSRYKRCDDSQ
jgi:hypothetical protein